MWASQSTSIIVYLSPFRFPTHYTSLTCIAIAENVLGSSVVKDLLLFLSIFGRGRANISHINGWERAQRNGGGFFGPNIKWHPIKRRQITSQPMKITRFWTAIFSDFILLFFLHFCKKGANAADLFTKEHAWDITFPVLIHCKTAEEHCNMSGHPFCQSILILPLKLSYLHSRDISIQFMN